MNAKERILKNILIDPNTQCWVWQCRVDEDGYARIEFSNGSKKFIHRYAYEAFVGKIKDGMSIDHICRNRKCCNPEHLQVMSIRDNVLAGNSPAAKNKKKTHCKHGHIFDDANTRYSRGHRICNICSIEITKRHLAKKRLGIKPDTVLEKIQKKLKPNEDGCMIWIGAKFTDGYGYLIINEKYVFVHKALYQEINGTIPNGMGVYRKCGNKLCCANEHLHLLPLGTVPEKRNLILVKQEIAS